MNFPDVPFDENLFSSNQMLKSYWERSTEKRLEATIPDYPSEETFQKNELEQESLKLWSNNKVHSAAEVADGAALEGQIVVLDRAPQDSPSGPAAIIDARVHPKSASAVLTIVFAFIAAGLILAYMAIHVISAQKKRY